MIKKLIVGSAMTALMMMPGVALAQESTSEPAVNAPNVATTPQTTTSQGFNPIWLLPLVLIPIAFLLWPRGEDQRYTNDDVAATYHDINRNEYTEDEEPFDSTRDEELEK